MSTEAPIDPATLRHLLPEQHVGDVTSVTPIRMGLSGAGVYAVTSSRGEYILRVSGAQGDRYWEQQLRILRGAAERGVAPPVVHVDEVARAVVSARVQGAPFFVALVNPAQRGPAIASLVEQLRVLHAMDPSGVEERDIVGYARVTWEAQRTRPGFPGWAAGVGAAFDAIASVLARDQRRVVGHNDVNPANVLWDGARAWLVDWDVAGLGHPYYDIATFATLVNLDAEAAHGLLSMQEQAPLDEAARATFAVLRELVALAIGSVFLSFVPDLSVASAPTRADAPTLAAFYAAVGAGELDMHTPRGQAMMGLAMLRLGTEATEARVAASSASA